MHTLPDFTQFRLTEVDAAIEEYLQLQARYAESATLDQLCRLYDL
jgi:hypothetical protein